MDKYVGKRLDGRYELKEIIGVGGMAVVYKAYDNVDDRIVAVKILKEELLQNQEFRRRFKNESKAIAVLSHPNIVKVYDVSFGDRLQYIVMEYIDGITLKEYIEHQGVIRWKDALHFSAQILRALQHAHDKGIVHRDIKPQNIMLLQDGTIKVTDFGIARFSRSERRTMTDKAIGSVHYISPEQARGEVTDAKSDLYSVGVMLYEMLTGKLPFEAESAVSVAIMQLQNEAVKPRKLNPDIPEGLEEITLHAMQKDPSERYQSAAEMLSDISRFEEDPTITFDYGYFIDKDPTKYVTAGESVAASGIDNEDEELTEGDEEKKSTVVPVLVGVTVAVVLVAVFIGLLLAGRYLGFGPFAKASDITRECPNLIGMDYNEVISSDEYKGFSLVLKSSEYSSDYPAGQIMSQTPNPGKTLKGDCEIVVKVSLGPEMQKLEDYVGCNVDTVIKRLDELKITYEIKELYSDDQAENYVVSTTPSAGESVATDSSDPSKRIILYVSKGSVPSFVNVGNYVGMTQNDAKRQVEGDGLKVGSVSTAESSTYPEGYVVTQSVTPGTTVDNGTTVNLVVSAGSAIYISVPIPDKAYSSFVLTVYHNGSKIYSSDSIDPSTLGTSGRNVKIKIRKNMADFDSDTATLVVKYSDVSYIQYNVNFGTGQSNSTILSSLSESVLGKAPEVEPEQSVVSVVAEN